MSTDKDNQKALRSTGRTAVAGTVAIAVGAALPGAVQAGVVVVDIDPDVTLGTYDLDIDGDTSPEFVFSDFGSNRVDTLANAVVGFDVPAGPKPGSYAEALGAGELIDGARGYVSAPDVILSAKTITPDALDDGVISPDEYLTVGDFYGIGGAFVGLQFDLGAATHYGWVEVFGHDDGGITLRRYGYEDIADTAITTPQLLSVPEPSSLALLAAGAAGAPLLRRRRQQKAAR